LKIKELLINRWQNNKHIIIYPGFVTMHNDKQINACEYMSLNDMSSFNYYINSKEKTPNYFKFDSLSCGATQINFFVVGPEGELYKCWNDIGRNEMIIGNVNDNKIINSDILAQYLGGPTSLDDEECINCTLFFVCNGGCTWQRIQNKIHGKIIISVIIEK